MKQIKEWEDLSGLKSGTYNIIVHWSQFLIYAERTIVEVVMTYAGYPRSMTLAQSVDYLYQTYGFDICLAPQFTAEQLKHIHAAKFTGMNWAAKEPVDGKIFGYIDKPIAPYAKRWVISGDSYRAMLLPNPIWQTIVTSTTEPFELFGEGE